MIAVRNSKLGIPGCTHYSVMCTLLSLSLHCVHWFLSLIATLLLYCYHAIEWICVRLGCTQLGTAKRWYQCTAQPSMDACYLFLNSIRVRAALTEGARRW